MSKRALVLLSGGLDSATCLAIAADEGSDVYTMAFDYGQRHQFEIQMSARQARAFGSKEHKLVSLDLTSVAKSALTSDMEVPKDGREDGIPSTYVPARNAIFLSIGLAWAEVLDAQEIFIGVNQVDFSGYPDCRDDFIQAFEKMANLATRAGREGEGFRLRTPLLHLDKAAIIKRGLELGVDYGNTHTCYDPDQEGRACGRCPACRLRLAGFEQAGHRDPVVYQDD